jgi:N6-adenosine-specific RNA methylase IME4
MYSVIYADPTWNGLGWNNGYSQKPDEIRDRIIELCGDVPRIELFARQKVSGCDSWGNEIKSDIDLEVL